MGENEQLRELHDTYTWEVNAAVGEGRLDLVWQLADDFVDRAVELIIAGEPSGCGRDDCLICDRPPRARVQKRHWWSHLVRRAATG